MQLKDNRSTVFVRLVGDKTQCLCISITAIKHKQRQAKQARETCFSMLIMTVCLLLKAYCILTLMLVIYHCHTLTLYSYSSYPPIFYHWQQLRIGFIAIHIHGVERQQEQAKNGTEWSFDADYYCLFIQHLHNAYACLLPLAYAIALQLFFLPLSYALSFTDYLASFSIKILFTAILLHFRNSMLANALFQGFQRKVSPAPLSKETVSCFTWSIHLPVQVAALRCLRLSHNIYRSKADFGCRQTWVYIININTKELGVLPDRGVQRKSFGFRV